MLRFVGDKMKRRALGPCGLTVSVYPRGKMDKQRWVIIPSSAPVHLRCQRYFTPQAVPCVSGKPPNKINPSLAFSVSNLACCFDNSVIVPAHRPCLNMSPRIEPRVMSRSEQMQVPAKVNKVGSNGTTTKNAWPHPGNGSGTRG